MSSEKIISEAAAQVNWQAASPAQARDENFAAVDSQDTSQPAEAIDEDSSELSV